MAENNNSNNENEDDEEPGLDKSVLAKDLLDTFESMTSDSGFSKGVGDSCADYLKLGKIVSTVGSAPPGSIQCQGSEVTQVVDTAFPEMLIPQTYPVPTPSPGDELLALRLAVGLDNMMNKATISGGNIASGKGVYSMSILQDGFSDLFQEMRKNPDPENGNKQMADGIAEVFTDYLTKGVITVSSVSGETGTGYIL